MWTCDPQPLHGARGWRYAPHRDAAALTYSDALDGWENDPAFRSWFTQQLADAPLAGYRWEVPPVTAATVGRPFEFVLMAAAGFARLPDPGPFAAAFASAGGAGAVAFPNLGGDAVLVAPRPTTGPPAAYTDLAAFVRRAADDQQHALWQTVAAAVRARLNARPLWLSTAGHGVAWLHVRLDDAPKYYNHSPYRAGPA